jgi:hypothetical protein
MSFVFEGNLPVAAPLAMFSRLDASWHPVSNDNWPSPPGAPIRPPAGQILPWVGKVDPVALSDGVGDAIRARLMEVGAQLIAQSFRDGPVAITTASDEALLLAEFAPTPGDAAPLPPSPEETPADPPAGDEPSAVAPAVEADRPEPTAPPAPVQGLLRHLEAAIGRIEATRQSARQAIVEKLAKPISVKRPDWLFGREGAQASASGLGGSLVRLANWRRRSVDPPLET